MTGSRTQYSRASRCALALCACLLLALAAQPALADIAQLKREIDRQERAVSTAAKELEDASRAVRQNQEAQKKATGAALQALKREIIGLLHNERKADEALVAARQDLAAKQGELRGEASTHAESQVRAPGQLDDRVDKARSAIADWQGALGDLPNAPKPRDLSDVTDEDFRRAFLRADIKRIQEYETWAEAETSRLDKEIKAAESLTGWKVGPARNGAALQKEAQTLKTKLEARKKSVEQAVRGAKQDRERLEKQLK